MTCDCRIVANGSRSEPWQIAYCPTHAAAGEMRALLADFVAAYADALRLRENSAAAHHLRRATGLLATLP